ncbi:PIG-L family deacetylase [Deinococcus sonorensis]|uniref:PIG-L family deacetylase n=2 Tax=Deinococcus sonorensis TaxID=309891 RepID=A0AAU7UEM0_9DEIO
MKPRLSLWPVPRRRWLIPVLVVAAVLALWINVAPVSRLTQPHAAARVAALPPTTPLRAGQRLLILSPHPDDETLCCAGLIQQATQAGASVYVVWLTSGDGFEYDAAYESRAVRPSPADLRALALRRMGEARRAAAALGIPETHLQFLGYPDGGLLHLFLENYASPYTSRTSGLDRVSYPGTRSPGSRYTGQQLEQDLEGAIAAVRPDLVLAPAPQDAHPDHRVTSYLALRLMARRGQLDRVRYWVVHGGLEWPLPKGLQLSQPLLLPPRAPTLDWTRLDLTAPQEQRKLQAVRAYRSQTALLGRFMEAFVRRNELYSRTPLPRGPLSEHAGPAAPP